MGTITMMDENGFRRALKCLGLTQLGASRLLDVDERTSRRWATGERDIPRAVELVLMLLIKLKITPQKALKIAKIDDDV